MRGSLKQRSKGSWTIILDLDATADPKRKQKWITIHGTKKDAEKKLTELVGAANGDTFVEPAKITVLAWLRDWLEATQRQVSPATYTRYHGIIENHIRQAPIGALPLQRLRPTHLEQYYATATGSASTLTLHHTVFRRALRLAQRDRLVTVNVAADLDGRPRRPRGRSDDARQHCWTASEARAFLDAATAAGPQEAAFYALAFDSGARKNELCGLAWADLDLEAGKMHVVRQLLKGGETPTYGPPKGKRSRVITLSAETIARLRAQQQQQRELKMKNRPHYHDHGLVFAKEWRDLFTRKACLGQPLQANNLGERSFDKLITVAALRRIKFHGIRHTCATLLLLAGEAVHVVSQRLGHRDVQTTLNTYAHVLPDAQHMRGGPARGAVICESALTAVSKPLAKRRSV